MNNTFPTVEQFIPCVKRALTHVQENPKKHCQADPKKCIIGISINFWLGADLESTFTERIAKFKDMYPDTVNYRQFFNHLLAEDEAISSIYTEKDNERAIEKSQHLINWYDDQQRV